MPSRSMLVFPREEAPRYLIRVRDLAFAALHATAQAIAITEVLIALRSPWQNGVTERFVSTARAEYFDRLLILNQQHLDRTLAAFIDHYNGHRPHHALSLTPPDPRRPVATTSHRHDGRVLRRDRLGGIVHQYERVAAWQGFHPFRASAPC